MNTPRIKTFWFCSTLEIGCVFIGWIALTFGLIALFAILLRFHEFPCIKETLLNELIIFYMIIGIYIIYILNCIVAGVILVIGTLKSQPQRLTPMRFLSGVGIFMSFPHLIITISFYGIYLISILFAVIMFYFYITIDSLYYKFMEGTETTAEASNNDDHSQTRY